MEIEARLESDFTKPSEFCPHPEWWHSPDEQGTEFEVTELLHGLMRAMQPELVIECGTHLGLAAYSMGRALDLNGHGKLLTYEKVGRLHAQAQARCRGVSSVSCFSLPTEQIDLGKSVIDFAWIDGKIERDEDFFHLHQWMRPGTIVGFHDTAPHQGGILERVGGLAAMGLVDMIRLRTPRGVTFCEVLG